MKDFRINKSKINGLDNDAFLWAVIEPIWPSTEDEDSIEYISQSSKGQQAIYSLTLFIREVDNGGLEQFLTNYSGKYIDMVIKGFELINAKEQLQVLKEAIKIFPQNKVPLDWHERNNVLQKQLKKNKLSAEEYFEKYNKKLYGEEQLSQFFMEYIKNNENEFFKD